MGWRDKYKVHPAADVFRMMSDEELQKLGEDIKKNGQTIPVLFWNGDGKGRILIDGRNRLEAMERVGIDPDDVLMETFICKDPITHIITLNIHRRHLTKQQQADLIVAAHAAAPVVSRQDGGKLPEGRPVNQAKAAAVATAAEHAISKRTVERAFAKAEGKTPKPKKPIEYSEPFAVNTACGRPTGITAMRVPVALLDGTRKRVVTEDGIVLEGVDDDDDEDGDEVDAIFPENYRQADIFRADGSVGMARQCIKLLAGIEAYPPKRRTKNVREDEDLMLRLTRNAALEWAELLQMLEEKQASTLPADGRTEVPVDAFRRFSRNSGRSRPAPKLIAKAPKPLGAVRGSVTLRR